MKKSSKWTRETPIIAGYYWIRWPNGEKEPALLHKSKGSKGVWFLFEDGGTQTVNEEGLEFCGPFFAPKGRAPRAKVVVKSSLQKLHRDVLRNREGSVVITGAQFKCTGCFAVKGGSEFGLRSFPDGTVRNQPQCKDCRSSYS
jgi:hypothetical protein